MDIKTVVKKKNINQTELSYLLGISRASLWKKMKGNVMWTFEERKMLQKILGLNSNEIKALIPEVRYNPAYPRPECKELRREFEKRHINIVTFAEKELHIAPISMARKMLGSYAFTEGQRKKIQEALGVTDERIDELIPKRETFMAEETAGFEEA